MPDHELAIKPETLRGVEFYRYRGEPRFTQLQLSKLFGISRDAISIAITRMVKSGEMPESDIVQENIITPDGKARLAKLYHIGVLIYIGFNLASDNEVEALHPLISEYLTASGCQFTHHLRLSNNKIADFYGAFPDGQRFIVEAKITAKEVLKAITQARNYAKQFENWAEIQLIVAIPSQEFTDDLLDLVQSNGADIWIMEGYEKESGPLAIFGILRALLGKDIKDAMKPDFANWLARNRHEDLIDNIDE